MPQRNPYHATVVAMLNQTRQLLMQLGPVEGMQLLERCMSRMERVVESYHGKVTDTSNWTLTAQFRDLETAHEAARTMQQRVEQLPPVSNKRISVSTGVAKTAARAMAAALTESPHLDQLFAEFTPTLPPAKVAASGAHLLLRYRHQTLVVDDTHREMKIGRSSECTLIVEHQLASRIHATIIKDGQRFALLDSSTNGTFVHTGQGKDILLHQRLHFLTGRGKISLTGPADQTDPFVMHFEVKPGKTENLA